MDPSDEELVRNCQDRSSSAFESLVRRWQESAARFLFHMVDRKESVPDLCQEVFLRVFQALPRYRETGHFSTWLYRIALNVAHDARRRPEVPLLPNGDWPAGTPSPAVAFEQHETAAVVRQAVAALPEPLRLVLVLRHYEGMSFEEMARLLGTPASTLKSRFAAALIQLRISLRALNDVEESPP